MCGVLSNSQSKDAGAYWGKLKQRLKEDGSELVTNCHRLKLEAQDGKLRETDVLDTKGILRLIQSIPSPKAEPFKMWLATVGSERLDRNEITEEQFKQVLKVERSEGEDNCYSEEVMREIFIRDQKDDNFVCYIDDEIVGYISYNPMSKRRNGSIYIINLVVLPEFRKQGIAQKLIYTACKYYKDEGYKLPMSLQVDKDNIPAINLYKKVGFEIKEPICESDKDEEQYIMAAKIEDLIINLEKLLNKNTNR